VAAAAERRQRAVEAQVGLARLQVDVGGHRLTDPNGSGGELGQLDLERCRNAAREDRRVRAPRARGTADGERVRDRGAANEHHQQGRQPEREHQSRQRRERQGERGARRGCHQRGTGTAPRAVLTASSGP
jgi:hypothetical protein